MVNEGRCEEFVYQGQIPLVQDLFNYAAREPCSLLTLAPPLLLDVRGAGKSIAATSV